MLNGITLKDCQVETIEYGLKNPYVIYALQQGLGKSLCALLTAHKRGQRLLVVCPAYLRIKWSREVAKFFGKEKAIVLIENDKDVSLPLFDVDVVIMSYYMLGSKYADAIFEWAECVAFDEAHLLKNMEAKRTLNAHKLVYENSVKSLYLLTGTPIQNRVHEFYSLMTLCYYNPKLKQPVEFLEKFPDYVTFADYFSNREEFTVPRGNKDVKVIRWTGTKNIPELKRYLKNIYIRRVADGVLPPLVEEYIPVEYKDYPELLKDFEKFAKDYEGDDAITRYDSSIKAKCALAKARYTIEMAKDRLSSGEPIIVYSDHVDSCIKIAEALGVPAITGAMPSKKRDILCSEFQSGERQAIVATIGALSTGQDLQRGNRIIINDPPFRYGELEQVIFRIRRIGQQSESCFVDYVIGSYQDEAIYKLLREKKRIIDAVV